ncbi:MAG: response regulator transcription factor [Lachnospiraceae bacterium]|nr:response regulator transcription factor [Lachnospiraceae bacterium]
MNNCKVLVVEDEKKLLYTLVDFLTIQGYDVLQAEDGEHALEQMREYMHEIDIVLLDIMLPGKNGYEVLKELRKFSAVPVIVLTAKAEVDDQVEGFECGADDYITKPYSLAVIKAHMEAVLKRAGKLKEFIESNEIRLEMATQKVYYRNEYLETTPKEFELLQYFMENEGVVLNRDRILNSVWGYYYVGDIRTVDTLVKQLRKKLKDNNCIRSVYGVGYVFGGEGSEKN